jgi:hypothetical protein
MSKSLRHLVGKPVRICVGEVLPWDGRLVYPSDSPENVWLEGELSERGEEGVNHGYSVKSGSLVFPITVKGKRDRARMFPNRDELYLDIDTVTSPELTRLYNTKRARAKGVGRGA